MSTISRRVFAGRYAASAALSIFVSPGSAGAENLNAMDSLRARGAVVLFRHALAPGGGDPPGFVPGDCRTQRNLSEEGREQARRIGSTLLQQGVVVQEVWHSEWCRCRDTANLAFSAVSPSAIRPEPAFNSFFGKSEREPAQSDRARKLLLKWRGPGALVVVTHQVNITAITGEVPQSGEGIVLLQKAGRLTVQGKIFP